MVASSPDRMSYVDCNYIYREVNHALFAAYQCSREDIVGRHLADIMGRESFEKTIKPHFDACLAGERVRFQDWFDCGVLGRRYFDVIYNPSRDARGKIIGVLVTSRDFTEAHLNKLGLNETRSQLNLVLATIEDVVWISDWNTKKVLFVSAAYERIWGRSLQELYENGLSWLSAVHPDDRERVQDAIGRVGAGDGYDEEFRVVRPDGSVRWVHDRGYPVCDPTDRKTLLTGIAQDITSRKRLEEALSIEQKRLHAFLGNSAVLAWMKDADGRYVFLSNKYEQRFRVRLEESLGKSDFDLWPKEVAEEFRRNDLQVLQSQRPIECIEKAVDLDGRESWWLISKFPFEDEDRRKYVGGLGVDVTERILADEERQNFVLLAENSQDFVGMCDLKFTPLYVNAAGLRLIGLDNLNVARRLTGPDFIFPEDRSFVFDEFLPRIEREGHGEAEIRFRNFRDVEPLWMHCTGFNLKNKDGVNIGWATVSRDITEQKRAERSRRQLEETISHTQKLDAIGRLAAGMAHDLNSMLMVVRGNADIIRSNLRRPRHDDRTVVEAIERVSEAVDRGKSLLDKLLMYGRVRSAHPILVDLNSVIGDTMRLMKPVLGKQIKVEARLEDGLRRCEGDASQLQQVVLNLLMNASDAMPDGGTLTIATENVDLAEGDVAVHVGSHRGPYVVLTVSDTGVGMDEEAKARLFEPFFSTKPTGKGTGLGLSIIYAVVRQAGGHIKVHSDLGKGAAFRILLPAVLN